MDRRRFLKASGVALGAGALSLSGLVAAIQPRRHVLVPAGNDARPERPSPSSASRRVVVVGAGVAGLAAATELAARGFEVTLVERASHVGGKLGGWDVAALGETFPMEHGFHGFFRHYYNLDELLAAADATRDLGPPVSYPVLYRSQPSERFGDGTAIFPLNLASVIARSRSLHARDFRKDGVGLEWLMRYDPVDTYRRFDGLSFREFIAASGIGEGTARTILEPFAKPLFQRLDALSAAEAIRFFHFYFMGNPEGLGFRYAKRDSMRAVLDPLRARFEARGGTVRLGTAAHRLVVADGRVRGVVVDAAGAGLDVPMRRVALADVPARGYLAVAAEAATVFVGRAREGGEIVALDGRCTHMGCPVAWRAEAGAFVCPCHAGRYDGTGAPVAGPPKRPLASLPVIRSGDAIVVGGPPPPSVAPAAEEVLACDYAVLACDVPGLREVIARSGIDRTRVARAVAEAGVADPYSVVRFWLDRPESPDRDPFYTVTGYPLTDSVAFYSRFQSPYVEWARRAGGSVVECHAYGIALAQQGDVARYRDRFLAELFEIAPELRGARVLHEEAMAQSNFTRYAPGDHARRPSTKTDVENLVLAGDHVALPIPAFLMEGAAVSGRLAANAILAAEGLREVPIPYVAPRGPLARGA